MSDPQRRGPERVRCPACAAEFTCDPAGSCWCATLPPLDPIPQVTPCCFCPRCLAARAQA